MTGEAPRRLLIASALSAVGVAATAAIASADPANPTGVLFREGTAAQWTALNPILALGEPGFESDTGRLKVGDGQTAWANLSPVATLKELTDSFIPRRIDKAGQDTITRIFELNPIGAGVAPFQIVHNEFPNGSGRPNNNGVWMGYNAERYLQNGSGAAGKAGWHIGLESGYWNPDDGSFGPEWYLNYTSPDGIGVPVATFRPHYVRVGNGDTNTLSDKWAHVLVDLGPHPEGVFAVTPGYGAGAQPSLTVKKNLTTLSSTQTVAEGTWFTVRPKVADSPAFIILDSRGDRISSLALRVNGAPAGSFIAANTNTFYIADKSDQPVLVLNYGTAPVNRQVNVRAKIKGDGVLELGGQVPVASFTGGTALGAAPVLTPGSNAARGIIQFGTGATPLPGDFAVMILPATYATAPNVVVSAANQAASMLRPYAYSTDAMTIRFGLGQAPPGGQPADSYRLAYQIVG